MSKEQVLRKQPCSEKKFPSIGVAKAKVLEHDFEGKAKYGQHPHFGPKRHKWGGTSYKAQACNSEKSCVSYMTCLSLKAIIRWTIRHER